VEAADKRFISSCAKAVSKTNIREHEVTRLLMTNRFFTQSNRMVILSMQALTREFALLYAAADNFNPDSLNVRHV
jgi:hypothetical protein